MDEAAELLLDSLKLECEKFGAELSLPKTTVGTNLLYLNIAVCEGTLVRKTLAATVAALGKSGRTNTDVLLQQSSIYNARQLELLCPIVSIAAMVRTVENVIDRFEAANMEELRQLSPEQVLSLRMHLSLSKELGGCSSVPPSVLVFGGFITPDESMTSLAAAMTALDPSLSPDNAVVRRAANKFLKDVPSICSPPSVESNL